jgi:hypothetical protein
MRYVPFIEALKRQRFKAFFAGLTRHLPADAL